MTIKERSAISETTILVTPTLTETAVSRRGHVSSLDFLRGFAALSVMLYHFSGGPPMLNHVTGGTLAKFYSPVLRDLFSWGNMGVEVFFVISGFVIPYSLWETNYQVKHFANYMGKRILRICPPAYFAMLLLLIQGYVISRFIHHNNPPYHSPSLELILRNILFLYTGSGDLRWFNSVNWTLAIEFQFYVLVGILFKSVFKNSKFGLFVLAFMLLSLPNFIPGFPSYLYFHYSSLFAIGGTALLYYKNRVSAVPFALTLALFFILTWLTVGPLAAAFGVGTAGIIIFSKLKHRLFTFLGKISFSLYLTHIMVGSVTEFLLVKIFLPQTAAQHVFGILCITVIACGFAFVFYHLVEQPTLRVVKKIKSTH
ncbi:acyltransferase family protein [Hymenobacter sp. HMF4947]|uniref:Acyltransferase family protein n=1 Tax=Hymenobacter ginkgonis TaxID=2682976 RepID=A0A7K1TGF5_9BACT|nr:acyltransferase [Hymenobacter ginkgonis]MVN77496.1 acyltransferase family protein [Hymenobacter ginkgonis]